MMSPFPDAFGILRRRFERKRPQNLSVHPDKTFRGKYFSMRFEWPGELDGPLEQFAHGLVKPFDADRIEHPRDLGCGV